MGWDRFLPHVYVVYAVVSLGLTVWLARTLGKNGQVFLAEVFADRPELGVAVNRLLVVGFYLVNLGYACLMLSGGTASGIREAIETLSTKLGWLLLSLAVMHFANLLVFHRIRRRAQQRVMPPPLLPHARVAADGTFAPATARVAPATAAAAPSSIAAPPAPARNDARA